METIERTQELLCRLRERYHVVFREMDADEVDEDEPGKFHNVIGHLNRVNLLLADVIKDQGLMATLYDLVSRVLISSIYGYDVTQADNRYTIETSYWWTVRTSGTYRADIRLFTDIDVKASHNTKGRSRPDELVDGRMTVEQFVACALDRRE